MSLVLEHVHAQPSMPPPPPPEDLVLASSMATARAEVPPAGAVDRKAFVETYREAMTYFDLRDWDLAEEALRRAAGIWAYPGVYLLIGYTYFYRGEYLRASNYFLKAAKRNPRDPAAHFSLALAYNRLRKPDKAIGAVWNVIKISHENPDAQFLLGYLRHQRRQWSQAEGAYREAIRLKKNFHAAYQYLALMYFEMGNVNGSEREERFREAIATYQRLIEADPSASASYVNVGYIYDQLGERHQAAEAYGKAVGFALSSGDLLGVATIGLELLEAGRYEEARTVFKWALDVLGDDAGRDGVSRVQILTWIGTAGLQRADSRESAPGDAELLREAEKSFAEALDIDPGYIHAQLSLGAVYYAQGRLDEAIEAFGRAIEIDPDSRAARANLAALVEDRAERRLYEAGLLKEIRKPITDFTPYQNRTPITVRGKPVSETILEDRR